NGRSPRPLAPSKRRQPLPGAHRTRAPRRARVQPAHRTVGIEELEPREERPGFSQRPNSYPAVMIVLVNPRSAKWKHRVPMSILSLAALLEGRYPYEIIDGNFEPDLEATLIRTIRETNAKYLGITVMPGPQLMQSIPLTKRIRTLFPH